MHSCSLCIGIIVQVEQLLNMGRIVHNLTSSFNITSGMDCSTVSLFTGHLVSSQVVVS